MAGCIPIRSAGRTHRRFSPSLRVAMRASACIGKGRPSMLTRTRLGVGLLLAAGALVGYAAAFGGRAPEDRQVDREAIAKLSHEFREAFERGDARAIAAFYTEQCEDYDDTNGEMFRGRAEVEKAFARDFKDHPGRKIVVQGKSLRFLGRDTAIQEGLVTLQSAGAELPVSTRFSCILVREDGQWKLALERE